MAAFTTIALVVGAAAAVGGAVIQHQAAGDAKKQQAQQNQLARQQADESQKQATLAKKQADIQNTRRIRASLRQARIARGSVSNLGANTGTGGGSGIAGSIASIGAQQGANLGTASQQGAINEDILTSQISSSNIAVRQGVVAGNQAATAAKFSQGQAISSAGKKLFSDGGGFATLFGA